MRSSTLCSLSFDFFHKIKSFNYFTEYNMSSIQPRSIYCCNIKLRAVSIGSGVSHSNNTWFMFRYEILIIKFITINWNSTSSVSMSYVSSLNHEIWNNSMKDWIIEGISGSAWMVITLANSNKIFDCFGNNRTIKI